MTRNTKPPRPAGVDLKNRGQTRPHALHDHNPAGTKLLKRFYRAKHGTRKDVTLTALLEWWALYNPRPPTQRS